MNGLSSTLYNALSITLSFSSLWFPWVLDLRNNCYQSTRYFNWSTSWVRGCRIFYGIGNLEIFNSLLVIRACNHPLENNFHIFPESISENMEIEPHQELYCPHLYQSIISVCCEGLGCLCSEGISKYILMIMVLFMHFLLLWCRARLISVLLSK